MKTRRILMSLVGVITVSIAIGFFKTAAFGVDPFQVFMTGLERVTPFDFGTLYLVANAVFLLFILVTDRRNIGFVSFFNLFLLGYTAQYTNVFLEMVFPAPPILLRVLFLAIGIIVLGFGCALCMAAGMGYLTYDAVAIILSDKWHLWKFKYVRICCDLLCVVLGSVIFLLSGGAWSQLPGITGVGTVITAFCMGPIISFFNEKVAKPLLREKQENP